MSTISFRSHPSTKVEKPDADEIGKISNRVPCDGIVRENKPVCCLLVELLTL